MIPIILVSDVHYQYWQWCIINYNTLQHRLNYSSMELRNIIMFCVTMVKPLNVHVVSHRMYTNYKCACTLAWIW